LLLLGEVIGGERRLIDLIIRIRIAVLRWVVFFAGAAGELEGGVWPDCR